MKTLTTLLHCLVPMMSCNRNEEICLIRLSAVNHELFMSGYNFKHTNNLNFPTVVPLITNVCELRKSYSFFTVTVMLTDNVNLTLLKKNLEKR